MMLKKTLIATAFSLLTSGAYAQSPAGEYFFMGIEFPMYRLKDKGHSPQTFSNGFFGVNKFIFGYEEIRPNFISRFKMSATMGDLGLSVSPKPKKKSLTEVNVNLIEMSYSYYKNVNQTNSQVLDGYVKKGDYFGGTFAIVVHINTFSLPTNNVMAYNVGSVLSVGGMVRRPLESEVNTKWRLNAEVEVPILAHVARPTYLGMVPVPDSMVEFSPKTVFKKLKFMPIGLYSGIKTSFQAEQQIRDYRARRFTYDWQLLHNSGGANPYTLVGGGFGYQSLFKM
ncbi:MAG: hypothetical protein RL757_60 [Bacteroidota bacterium]|jgi:hypothetical protein